jgi:hypothetical protein
MQAYLAATTAQNQSISAFGLTNIMRYYRKFHLVTDGRGLPLAVEVTAG